MEQLIRLLTLQDANTRVVLLGAGLLGLASGVIGCFAVLRRRALVGDAVAHAALPGICLAYFVVGDRNFAAFLLGALIMGVFAAWLVSFVRAYTRVREDAAIGIVIGSFFGLGVVLSRVIQNEPSGNRAGLDSFIFGKAASMVRADAWLIAAVAGLVLLFALALYKELKTLCFDREFAAAQGWPTLGLDLALMAMVCICTVVGLPAVGIVLMVALMIIPGAAARFWSDRLGSVVLIAGVVGLLAGVLGTALSAVLPSPASGLSRGWPTGPLIVLTAGGCFIVSMLFAPRRGVLADVARKWAFTRRVRDQNLLRSFFEASELAASPAEPDGAAAGRAVRRGLIQHDPSKGVWGLTPKGLEEARTVVRTHRLWELYLIERAGIAPDHVDRDADELEHMVSPELLARLEERLAEIGRLPRGTSAESLVPASPHALGLGVKR